MSIPGHSCCSLPIYYCRRCGHLKTGVFRTYLPSPSRLYMFLAFCSQYFSLVKLLYILLSPACPTKRWGRKWYRSCAHSEVRTTFWGAPSIVTIRFTNPILSKLYADPHDRTVNHACGQHDSFARSCRKLSPLKFCSLCLDSIKVAMAYIEKNTISSSSSSSHYRAYSLHSPLFFWWAGSVYAQPWNVIVQWLLIGYSRSEPQHCVSCWIFNSNTMDDIKEELGQREPSPP